MADQVQCPNCGVFHVHLESEHRNPITGETYTPLDEERDKQFISFTRDNANSSLFLGIFLFIAIIGIFMIGQSIIWYSEIGKKEQHMKMMLKQPLWQFYRCSSCGKIFDEQEQKALV